MVGKNITASLYWGISLILTDAMNLTDYISIIHLHVHQNCSDVLFVLMNLTTLLFLSINFSLSKRSLGHTGYFTLLSQGGCRYKSSVRRLILQLR